MQFSTFTGKNVMTMEQVHINFLAQKLPLELTNQEKRQYVTCPVKPVV
jgi:hypothetical protein